MATKFIATVMGSRLQVLVSQTCPPYPL
uniref:Uncharacterized protein n=1 Tax=Anguilla anguilla TaxID=7936 RepID=A0A0E9QMD1_ANGAN